MAQFEKNEKTAAPSMKPAVKPDVAQNVNDGAKNEESISYKVGDGLERVGEKLKDMGAEKIGSAVYNAGNKMEHSDKAKKH